ncbi:MAG: hypothetical protein JEY71_11810 [Sphaerochaeta sp.]|nr:hypothetical protein [Sphaerochaeta sp.]
MKVVMDELTECTNTKFKILDVPVINISSVSFIPPAEVIEYFETLFREINRNAEEGMSDLRSGQCVIGYRVKSQSEKSKISFLLKLDSFEAEVVAGNEEYLRYILKGSHPNGPTYHKDIFRDPSGHEKIVYVKNEIG